MACVPLAPKHFLAINGANWYCLRIDLPLVLLPLRSLLLLIVAADPFTLRNESIIHHFSLRLPSLSSLMRSWLVYRRKQSLISFMRYLLPIKWDKLMLSSIYDLYCYLPKPRLLIVDFSQVAFGIIFPVCSVRNLS
jgi:hypothetical protein